MTEVINNIIHFPATCNTFGDVSVRTLLDQTGYIDEHQHINVKDILEGLNEDPIAADSWLIYSADKRSTDGWYILDMGESRYQVGYYPEDVNIPVREYTNLNEACAIYIKQELEYLRRS